MGAAKSLTDQNFTSETSSGYVLVDFWAEWCGPCRQLGPLVEELATEMAGKIKVCKMNVDENPETPSQFGVRGIPTMIILQDGKLIATKVGSIPKKALVDWVNGEVA